MKLNCLCDSIEWWRRERVNVDIVPNGALNVMRLGASPRIAGSLGVWQEYVCMFDEASVFLRIGGDGREIPRGTRLH